MAGSAGGEALAAERARSRELEQALAYEKAQLKKLLEEQQASREAGEKEVEGATGLTGAVCPLRTCYGSG